MGILVEIFLWKKDDEDKYTEALKTNYLRD